VTDSFERVVEDLEDLADRATIIADRLRRIDTAAKWDSDDLWDRSVDAVDRVVRQFLARWQT
jgi:hypothetical protein